MRIRTDRPVSGPAGFRSARSPSPLPRGTPAPPPPAKDLFPVPPVRVRRRGLNPAAVYRDETGKLYSGATLMYLGFSAAIPGDFGSCVMLLEKVE